MKTIFEQLGGTYRQVGDYLMPIPPVEVEHSPIGKYGEMRRSFLKDHRPALYTEMILSGSLLQHLAEVDKACNDRMALIIPAMAQQEGVTDTLKADNQMEWVGRMNNIHHCAEEIVLNELVFQ